MSVSVRFSIETLEKMDTVLSKTVIEQRSVIKRLEKQIALLDNQVHLAEQSERNMSLELNRAKKRIAELESK